MKHILLSILTQTCLQSHAQNITGIHTLRIGDDITKQLVEEKTGVLNDPLSCPNICRKRQRLCGFLMFLTQNQRGEQIVHP